MTENAADKNERRKKKVEAADEVLDDQWHLPSSSLEVNKRISFGHLSKEEIRESGVEILHKLVLKVIPRVIKNQLTLNTELRKKKKENAKKTVASHLLAVDPCESNAKEKCLNDAANKIKKTH